MPHREASTRLPVCRKRANFGAHNHSGGLKRRYKPQMMENTKSPLTLLRAAALLPLLAAAAAPAQTRVAIFGGSVAQYFNDRGAQAVLAGMMPGTEFHNFGKAGDGLCKQTEVKGGKAVVGGIPKAVAEQCAPGKEPYDIYIIWCSTNDIWGNPVGTPSDFTEEDGFDERKLATQCGGLNYCFREIQRHAPEARILLFASLKSFNDSYGYSRTGAAKYSPPRRMCDYVDAQVGCAERFSVPVLNLWAESGINEYNFKKLCPDGIHPTAEAYIGLCPLFRDFISRFTGGDPRKAE